MSQVGFLSVGLCVYNSLDQESTLVYFHIFLSYGAHQEFSRQLKISFLKKKNTK